MVALFTWRKVRMSMNLFLGIKELQNCCENSTTLSRLRETVAFATITCCEGCMMLPVWNLRAVI